jgi:glutaconate CoA-transferase, subunit B
VVSERRALERMLALAARLVPSSGAIFAGFNWPILAVRVARLLHAAGVTVVYENGIVEDQLTKVLPTAPTDLAAADNSPALTGSLDALFLWLRSGRIDMTFIDAPIVDQMGNINSTALGSYGSPKVRLAGSGGGSELTATGRSVVLMCSGTTARSYPRRVDYITSPGYLAAAGDRARFGYPAGRGPVLVVTPLGLLGFDSESLVPRAVFADVTVSQLSGTFRWLDAVDYAVATIPEPSQAELDAVTSVLTEARARRYRLGT